MSIIDLRISFKIL